MLRTALLFCSRSFFSRLLKQVYTLLYQRGKLGAPVGIGMAQPVADTPVSNQPIQRAFTASKICRIIAKCQLPYIRALQCGKHISENHIKSQFFALVQICVRLAASRVQL